MNSLIGSVILNNSMSNINQISSDPNTNKILNSSQDQNSTQMYSMNSMSTLASHPSKSSNNYIQVKGALPMNFNKKNQNPLNDLNSNFLYPPMVIQPEGMNSKLPNSALKNIGSMNYYNNINPNSLQINNLPAQLNNNIPMNPSNSIFANDIFAAGSGNLLQGSRIVQSLSTGNLGFNSHSSHETKKEMDITNALLANNMNMNQSISGLTPLYPNHNISNLNSSGMPLLQPNSSFLQHNNIQYSDSVILSNQIKLKDNTKTLNMNEKNNLVSPMLLSNVNPESKSHNSSSLNVQVSSVDKPVSKESSLQPGSSASLLYQGSTDHNDLVSKRKHSVYEKLKQFEPNLQDISKTQPNKKLPPPLPKSVNIGMTKPIFPNRKPKEIRPMSTKELFEESFSNILKRREQTVSKLSSIEKRDLITLNPIMPRFPKVKSSWDFLIEEVQWMSLDFRQERRWKTAIAKSISESFHGNNIYKNKDFEFDNYNCVDDHKTIASKISKITSGYFNQFKTNQNLASSLKKIIENHETSQLSDSNIEDTANSKTFDNFEMESIDRRSKSSLSLSVYNIANSLPTFKCEDYLHKHQIDAMKAIFSVNQSGLGALLFGDSWVGKTFLMINIMKEWTIKQNSTNIDPNKSSSRPIVLFVAKKCIHRWTSEIKRIIVDCNIYVYNSSLGDTVWPQCDIVICLLEPLIACLTSNIVEKLTKNWLGVIIDVRGLNPSLLKVQLNSINLGKVSSIKLINTSHWLSILSNCFPSGEIQRCLISENNIAPEYDPTAVFELSMNDDMDKFLLSGMLAFVSPGIVGPFSLEWLNWTEDNNKRVDILPSHRPYEILNRVNILLTIARNPTLGEKNIDLIESERFIKQNEFISSLTSNEINSKETNLIETSDPKCDTDSSDNSTKSSVECPRNLINEDLLSVEMDQMQLYKYYSILEALVIQSAFAGDNLKLVSKAIMLMRRVCFHDSLVLITNNSRISSFNEANDDKFSSTDHIDEHEQSANSGENHNEKEDPMSNNKIEIQDSAATSSTSYSVSLEDIEMHPRRPSNPSVEFFPGYLRNNLLSYPDLNLFSSDILSLGSCKFKALGEIIRKFKNKKIVLVTETIDELLLLHKFLIYLSLGHIHPNLSCYDKSENDYNWYVLQEKILRFNTSTLPDILIVLTNVFNCGNCLIPYTADLILVLSDNWTQITDIKKCVQLGRLVSCSSEVSENKYPSNEKYLLPNMTILRIITRGTLEEAIIKCGGSLAYLQGKKLNEVHPSQFSKIFNPSGLSKIASYNSLLGITVSLNILNLAPPLTRAYRMQIEKANDAKVSVPSFDEPKKIGIGKGKGKGLLIQGPRGTVVPASNFNSLPFASTIKIGVETNTSEQVSINWLNNLKDEVFEIEFFFNSLYLTSCEKFWPETVFSNYNQILHKTNVKPEFDPSSLDESQFECSIENHNIFLNSKLLLNLKFEKIISSIKQFDDASYFLILNKSRGSSKCLENKSMVPSKQSSLLFVDVSPNTNYSSSGIFRETFHDLGRFGYNFDSHIYTHPLQLASGSDMLIQPNTNIKQLVDSQFILKYVSKASNKSIKKGKIQFNNDSSKSQSCQNFTSELKNHGHIYKPSDNLNNFGLYSYGPKAISTVKKPIKIIRESDISLEPWLDYEDELIMQLSKKYGKNAWLLEHSLVLYYGGQQKIRSSRQIRERLLTLSHINTDSENNDIIEYSPENYTIMNFNRIQKLSCLILSKSDRNSDDLILDTEQIDQDLPDDHKRSLYDLNSQSSENESLNNTEILPTNLNLNIQYAPPFEIFKKAKVFH